MQFITFVLLTAFLSTPTSASQGNLELSYEKRLIRDLLETYKQAGVVGRPVVNYTQAITVGFGLSLIQILNLDEKNQVLTISAWNSFIWKDYLLSWNTSDYNGVEIVRVPIKDIWKPDIVLYNYADERLQEIREAFALIAYDGTVEWLPPSLYKSSCQIDITNFPFDTQICHLKFGSWTFDGFRLDLVFHSDIQEISVKDYVPSNEWDLLAHPARRNVIYYPCCKEPFPDLTFTLVLRRQVAFYSYILILPCVLLSLLTMVLFWLPPESTAKMQLGMNIFVAFFLLLLLLTDNTPPAASSIPLIGMSIFVAFFVLLRLLAESAPPAASNVPLIGAYYCLNMIMITLSTFMATIIIHLYFRGPRTNKVPYWLKKVVLVGLAKLVCMKNYVPQEKPPAMYNTLNPRLQKEFKRMRIQELKYNKYQVKVVNEQESIQNCFCKPDRQSMINNFKETNHSPDISPLRRQNDLESDVKEIKRFLKTYLYKQKTADNVEKIRGEWRSVALVLDRGFFWLYVLSIIVSLAVMFPRGT